MTTIYQVTVTEELMADPVAFHALVASELRRVDWFVLKTQASVDAEAAVKSYSATTGVWSHERPR